MDWGPFLFLGVVSIFLECNAMMGAMYGGPNMMVNTPLFNTFQSNAISVINDPRLVAMSRSYPRQNCELIDNPDLHYPDYKDVIKYYESKLLALNSYVCADYNYAEPYYKMETVMKINQFDYRMLSTKPGVMRTLALTQNGRGIIMTRVKYYDVSKKLFNIYTGKYVKDDHKSKPRRRVPVEDRNKVKDKKDKEKVKDKLEREEESELDKTVEKAKEKEESLEDSGNKVVDEVQEGEEGKKKKWWGRKKGKKEEQEAKGKD